MEFREETVSEQKVYRGNIITVSKVFVTLPNGKQASRDIVTHPGAAVVIPVNEEGEVFMVRQFRKPLEKTLLELPAGKLDPGEDPRDCALRELYEETGLKCKELRYLTRIYSTPGFCNEVLYIYMATGLELGDAHTDDDEFLTREKHHISKLMEMVLDGTISDAKTIVGIMLAARHLGL